jgi:hypothetical protein
MFAAKTEKLRAKGQWLRAAFPRRTSPPNTGGACSKAQPPPATPQVLSRGRETVAPTVGHRNTAVAGRFGVSPGQPAFIAGCKSRRRRSPSDPASISHTGEVVVNRQNLYIGLITRWVCQPAQIMSPLTRMNRKASHMHMSDKTLGPQTTNTYMSDQIWGP